MGTVGGIIAGAVGAHELERGYEKRRERKRAEEEGGGGRGARRRSSGGLMGEVKEKVEGFLKVGDEGGKRRSRSHGGSEGKGGYGYGYGSEVDGDEWERYERREGGRRRARDDYH